jgi:putative ABC transport system permease protein
VLLQNFRFALRQLRKAPGFTLIVVLTLALGIGATTAVFSLVEGILLRPLPFHQPSRLVLLGDILGARVGTPGLTAREIATYSAATTAFSSLGGYATAGYELSGGATPEQVNIGRFTAPVFSTLGVEPLLGRVFSKQEADAHQPVAVISYALWLDRFHRDPHILGNSIVLDRKTYTILGVMPRSFEYPLQDGHLDQARLWIPLNLSAEELSESQAGAWRYQMVGRLKEGVSLSQAAQDVDRVARQAMHDFPPTMSAIRIHGDVKPLQEFAVAGVRPLLRTLFFAVVIVLLLACLNVAGLLLVRAIRRRREYSVRLALGARSSVILRESAAEGLLLSVVSSVLGLAFASAAIHTTLKLLPESLPRIDSISIDANVVMFAVLLALTTGALCSLAPAFAALRTNLVESLKEGAQTGSGAAGHTWLRSALVVSEIAIAMVLITAAGALLRSYQRMRAVDPGFQPDQVLVASYQLPLNQYSTNAAAERFNHTVVERLSNPRGVGPAPTTSAVPSSGMSAESTYTIEGQPEEGWKLKFAMFTTTYGDYFHAMGIPLLDGRTFTEEDNAGTPLVVIVNQSMAKHSWPGERAVGKRMHVGNPKKGLPWVTVVGVVADTRLGARDEPAIDQWFSPLQQPAILNGVDASEVLPHPASGYIALRSALPPEQITQTLRSTIAGVDPLLAIEQVQPMSEVISNVEAPRRFNTYLISAFAAGALLLAITGIYAVVAFSVSLRAQEIAIRMALGAPRAGITRLVVFSGAKLALIGCGLGVLGSLAVSRLVSGFLFDVSATDPLIYAVGVLVVMLMALLASAFPAGRAASADPIDALRST